MMNNKLPLQNVASAPAASRPNCPDGDPHDCPLACPDVCALHPGEQVAPIDFVEARSRFEREASHGICNTGRYRMPYYTWGEGPPLLFVHGLGDSSLSFLMPIAKLSTHFRCIAYDQPSGYGDAARLRRYSHDDLVADIWALLDHLGVRQSYILGSSFGATITFKALHDRPERLPRGIVQGGLVYRPLRRAERFVSFWGRFLPGRMGRLPLREKVLLQTVGTTFKDSPPEVWQYFLDCTGRAPLTAVAHQARMLHCLDLRAILPAIRQPVLLVCGDQDRVVPRVHEEMLLQGLPSAGRIVIESCGHVPSYTHPEILALVVRRFLTPPV